MNKLLQKKCMLYAVRNVHAGKKAVPAGMIDLIPQQKCGSHSDAISIAYLKQKRKVCADEKDSPPEKAVFYDYGGYFISVSESAALSFSVLP